MKKILFPVAALVFLAGCAADSATTATSEKDEAVYTTGSNIPKKVRSGDPTQQTLSKEEWVRQKERGVALPNPNSGGGNSR
jgi:outer membrane lipoprotein-sorting protein